MSPPANHTAETPLAAYVDPAAELLGLTLLEEHRRGVTANLAILAALAAPLLEFSLAPDIEPAPVFEP